MGWLLVWLLTQLVALVVITFLLALGLILIEFLVYPLALGIGALLASLTAVFAANLLVNDGLQTPVNPVVGRTEVTAVVLAILLIAAAGTNLLRAPLVYASVITAAIITFVAVYTAWRFRAPPMPDPGRRRRVLIWLLLALAAPPLVIFIASLFGWAGA